MSYQIDYDRIARMVAEHLAKQVFVLIPRDEYERLKALDQHLPVSKPETQLYPHAITQYRDDWIRWAEENLGIPPRIAGPLFSKGYCTPEQIDQASEKDLDGIRMVTREAASQAKTAARQWLEENQPQ